LLREEENEKALGVRGIATNTDEGMYNFEYEIRCPTEENPSGEFSMKILAVTPESIPQ
jgi:hypothetical protein